MKDKYYLKICIEKIERKLGRGKLSELSGHSFEQLSEDIFNTSGIRLSGRTLRRLANNKINNPQIATKNALTQFLGFKNWEDFIKNISVQKDEEQAINTSKQPSFYSKFVVQYFWLIMFSTITFVVFIIFSFYPTVETELIKSKVVLQSNDIRGTAPHKASFFYDVSRVKISNIFIDNDFYGDGELVPVKKNQHFYDKTFDLPGYYAVKIIANGERLTCVGVHVVSEGWSTVINDNLYPDIKPVQDNQLQLPDIYLKEIAIDSSQNNEINFRNIQDFETTGDEMTFETRFKNDDPIGTGCNSTKIEIINVHGRLAFNFINPGCDEKMLKANFGDVAMSGEFNNLNTFRQDISYWRDLKIVTSKKRVNVFLDDVQIYTIRYHDQLDQIKGLSFSFNGKGAVDYVRLYNENEELIYSEDFERPI